jgi:hypothetical protein
MFTRVKPLGWAFLEILTSTQMNQLDTNASRAIDGLNGGVYTLAVMLELAGAGVKFSTVAEFAAAAVAFTGAGSVTVGSGTAWTFNNPVLFNALATLNGSATVPSGASLAIEDGASMIVGPSGAITNNGGLQNAGVIFNDGRMINRGEGRIHRRSANLPDADTVVEIAAADIFMMPAGGSARDYTMSNVGVENDDEVEFRQTEQHTTPAGHTLRINPTSLGPPAGGNIFIFGVASDPLGIKAVRCRRRGGAFDFWYEKYGPL